MFLQVPPCNTLTPKQRFCFWVPLFREIRRQKRDLLQVTSYEVNLYSCLNLCLIEKFRPSGIKMTDSDTCLF